MDQQQPPKRRGRPPKPPGELKRAPFVTRMREGLRERLEVDAGRNGRSLSEEVEARLERSYDGIESQFGGPAGLRMAMVLSASFNFAGFAAAQMNGHLDWTSAEWMADPECFERALARLVRSTWEHHPQAATGQDLLTWLEQLHRSVLSQELTKQWNSEREAEAAAAKSSDEAA